jgi:transcriptional regulator
VYLPPFFREERVDVLHALVRAHPLAALITLDSDGIVANHIPLLVDAEPAPLGTLVGHVARANPVWRDFSAEVPSLAIFSGPEHYISPSWYPSKAEDGRVVPTWNYAVVHVYGRLEIHEDPEWLRALVTRLTATHEAQFEQPWAVTDAPVDYVDGLLKAIVGIEMHIERIEGKWKMGQNRSAEDRRGAVAGLMKGRSETCPTD